MQNLNSCRDSVHKWGVRNRVSFVIMHPRYAFGDPFKLLGCLMDTKLIMKHAIDKVLSQIRPKIRAILRTRHHYDCKALVNQFKSYI